MSIADSFPCSHCLFHNVSLFHLFLNRHDLAAPVVPVVAQHDVAPIAVPVVAPQDVAPQPGPEDGAPVKPLEEIGVIGAGPAEYISQEIGGRVENDAAQPPTPTGPSEEIGSVRNDEQASAEQVSSAGASTEQALAAEPVSSADPVSTEPASTEPAASVIPSEQASTEPVSSADAIPSEQALAAEPVSSADAIPSEAESQLARVMNGDCGIQEFLFGPPTRSCEVHNLMQLPPSSADVVEAVVEADAEEDEQPLSKQQKITNDAEEAEPLSNQQEDEPMPKRQKKQAAEEGEPLVKLTAGQLKSLKLSELHVTAAKLKVKRPRDHKNNYLITLILEKMEALPDPPDTDKYGHVLSLLKKGKVKSLSDLAKSG